MESVAYESSDRYEVSLLFITGALYRIQSYGTECVSTIMMPVVYYHHTVHALSL